MAWKDNRIFTILTMCYWIVFCIAFNLYGYTAGLILSIPTVVVYVFLPLEKEWLFVFSTLPFMAAFKISAELPSISIILYIIFIIKSMKASYLLKKRFFMQLIILFMIQFTLLICYGKSIISLISLIVNLVFMIQAGSVIEDTCASKKDAFLTITMVYVMAVTLMSFMSKVFPDMVSLISPEGYNFMLDGNLTSRYAGIAGDPNYYAQLLMIAIAMAISSIMVCGVNIMQMCLLIVSSGYLVFCGMLTYSKSFYVTLAIFAVIMMCYVYIRGAKNKVLLALLVIAIPAVICLLYYFLIDFVFPGILQRVTATVDLTTGRTSIWASYFDMLISNPLVLIFGAGTNNAKNLIAPFYGEVQVAHNAFIEILSDTGAIGCILFLNMYKDSLKKAMHSLKNPMCAFFLIFAITSLSLSLSAYDTVCFIIPMLYLLDVSETYECSTELESENL